MKMTKKILLGAAALFATVAFISCGGAAEEDGIMKVGETLKIDTTNETDSVIRNYQETRLNHAGGLVKVTFNSTSSDAPGMMGFIFDLKGKKNEPRDFFIIGLNGSDEYYVSKFTGVTDFQAKNFGAADIKDGGTEGTAEKELAPLGSKLVRTIPTDEEGNKFAYIYVIANDNGSFSWKILDDKVTDKTKKLSDKEFKALTFSEEVLASGEISADDTGYEKQTQGKLACYANVYARKTLVGQWDYIGTFKEADFVEE